MQQRLREKDAVDIQLKLESTGVRESVAVSRQCSCCRGQKFKLQLLGGRKSGGVLCGHAPMTRRGGMVSPKPMAMSVMVAPNCRGELTSRKMLEAAA
jgi:hypothetical protein